MNKPLPEQFKSWRTNNVTLWVLEQLQNTLNEMRKQHEERNYIDLKEVGMAQGRICVTDRFIKRILSIDASTLIWDASNNLSKEEDNSEES